MTQCITRILGLIFLILFCASSFAQKADVLILTGPGGHRTTSDHVAKLLREAGISYAEVDFSTFSDWTFEQTVELSERAPESSTEFYNGYYIKAAKAKSIAELPQAQWHYDSRFMSVLNVVKPKIIYSAYPISSEIIKKLNEHVKIKGLPYSYSQTDYNINPYWTYSLPTAADMVFPPSLDWMMESIRLGTPPGKMLLTGIAGNVNLDNVLTPEEISNLWKSLDFDPSILTVYIGGGSGGIGEFDKMLESIKEEFSDPTVKLQVLFAVGSSQKKMDLINEARKALPDDGHIRVAALGFTPRISDYMNYIADIDVSKAGGLTTTEIALSRGEKDGKMRRGRPFLAIVPAFGVESGNVEFGEKKGMLKTTSVKELGKNIKYLLDHPEVGRSMMEKQKTNIADINRPGLIIEWIKLRLQKMKENNETPYIAESSTMWVYEKLKLQVDKKEKPFISYPNTSSEELIKQYEATRSPASTKPVIKMAITVDDIPGGAGDFDLLNRRETLDAMIKVLQKHNVPRAYGFINGASVGQYFFGEAMLKDWLAAGFELGNHTDNHLSLSASTASEYIEDIAKTDERLEKLGVQNRRYFRYPFLQEGNTPQKRKKVEKYLDENGYTVAPISVDITDYKTNDKYTKTLEKSKSVTALISKATDKASKTLKQSQTLAKELYGRDINHILLLHLAAVHVEMLDQILTQYENDGVQFVTLEEAMSDPVYNEPRKRTAETMGNFLEEMAYEKGLWTEDDASVRLKRCSGELEF